MAQQHEKTKVVNVDTFKQLSIKLEPAAQLDRWTDSVDVVCPLRTQPDGSFCLSSVLRVWTAAGES